MTTLISQNIRSIASKCQNTTWTDAVCWCNDALQQAPWRVKNSVTRFIT